MDKGFIMYHNFKGFNSSENVLMSLIYGLNKSKKVICFSNKYAAHKCCVSERQITKTISKFIELGFIKTYHNTGMGRVIHLCKLPEIIEYEIGCDIEAQIEDVVVEGEVIISPRNLFVVQNSIPTIEQSSTDIEQSSTDIEQSSTTTIEQSSTTPEQSSFNIEQSSTTPEQSSNNNIVYNIDDNIVYSATTQQNQIEDDIEDYQMFLELFVLFDDSESDVDALYEMWKNIPSTELKSVIEMAPNYINYEKSRKHKAKLFYYFKDKKYLWNTIRNWKKQKV